MNNLRVRRVFRYDDINYIRLAEILGGEDILRLMIEADGFEPIYHNDEGLRFTFRSPMRGRIERVHLIPHVVASGSTMIRDPYYQIRIVLMDDLTGGDQSSVVTDSMDELPRMFERAANVAITF